MDENDRKGPAHPRGSGVLHNHLSGYDRSVRHLFVLGVHPEMTLIGELDRCCLVLGAFCNSCRFRSRSRNILLDPIQDRLQHLAVVFLRHHHVAIAMDAVIGQPQLFSLTSRLLEECRCCRTARRSERRFSRDENHWDSQQIFEFPCGLFLQFIRLNTGFRGRDRLCLDFGRILDRRIVRDRNRREPPRRLLAERRATGSFNDDDPFHEAGPRLSDEPAERATRRVRHDDRRSDLVEKHRAALPPDLVCFSRRLNK